MSPDTDEGLRFIFAGGSIVSDWGNPAATTNRAVMYALVELGHEATYLEPRRDAAVVELLRARGSEPLRAFRSAFPALQYRTVDVPAAFQASAWAGQFLSTASAAVALDGCPSVIEEGFRPFQSQEMRFLVEQLAAPGSELIELPDQHVATWYQPAVLPRAWRKPRSGTVLVAYDDAELALAVAAIVKPDSMIVSGRAELATWEWVPEVNLPERYGGASRVLVVDGRHSIAPARVCLPRAHGATAWGVVDGTAGDALNRWAVAIENVGGIDWTEGTPISPGEDARTVAGQLAATAQRSGLAAMNGNR